VGDTCIFQEYMKHCIYCQEEIKYKDLKGEGDFQEKANEADGLAISVEIFFFPTEDPDHLSKVIKVLLSGNMEDPFSICPSSLHGGM